MCRTRNNSDHSIDKSQKPSPMEKTGDCLMIFGKAIISSMLIFTIFIIIIMYYSTFNLNTRPTFFHWPDHQTPNRPNTDNSPTNISHIAFGIGASARTWAHRGKYSALWWKPNITRGFVFIDQKPDPETRFSIHYKLSSSFRHPGKWPSAVRISRVLVDLFRVGLPNVRWFVMGDDDTVFFTENLVTVLSKYGHNEMVYIGGNSESVEQNVMHAYDMAFGGGGFAISYPLAAELVKIFDGCLDRYQDFYGSDQRVWACVGELGVSLSRESGFHQIDIRGDPYGLLAAHPMKPLVSLHHLDYVKPLFPNQSQIDSLTKLMKAYGFDPSRMLQQSFCYHHKLNWSVSISWGYTVQLYPRLLPAHELKLPLRTFKTWRSWRDGPFTFNTRPIDPDPCNQPVIFYFDSVREATGYIITSFKNVMVTDEVKRCNNKYARVLAIESVIVKAPKMDPQEWKKVPRRHCCDIGRSMVHSTMKIRIRKCQVAGF